MTAARTLRITAVTPDLVYAQVTEGKTTESYRLDVGYSCVRWVHTGDPARGGIVTVNGAGRATGCDCKGWRWKGKCKHAAGTTAAIQAGRVEPGCVSETRDGLDERPESYLYSTEGV